MALAVAVRSLEPRLEKVVRRFASRGRVDISLILQYAAGSAPSPRFDSLQAAAMLESLHALAASRGEDFAPDYNALLQISSLWGDTGRRAGGKRRRPAGGRSGPGSGRLE